MRYLYLLVVIGAALAGCSTVSTATRDGGVADSAAPAADAAPDLFGDAARDAGSEIYDGPLDEALPCPREGFSVPCMTLPEVVYVCRCVELHCVEGTMIKTPQSPTPCP